MILRNAKRISRKVWRAIPSSITSSRWETGLQTIYSLMQKAIWFILRSLRCCNILCPIWSKDRYRKLRRLKMYYWISIKILFPSWTASTLPCLNTLGVIWFEASQSCTITWIISWLAWNWCSEVSLSLTTNNNSLQILIYHAFNDHGQWSKRLRIDFKCPRLNRATQGR